jgi:hypothetical protein
MNEHRNRDDFSRFLVHLTRDYCGKTAQSNLRSILRAKRIEARNPHCLFHHKIKNIGLSTTLKRRFNTVCFTETPLNQLRFLARKIKGRQIQLKPYGLVFWKDNLLEKAANPAIYINSQAEGLREFLISEFDRHFDSQRLYRSFRRKYGSAANSIIRYYSLVNIISERVDFSWEREWRHTGDLKFDFHEIVAIIAPDPEAFRKEEKRCFRPTRWKAIKKIPVISPEWNYEQVVEELTLLLWETDT